MSNEKKTEQLNEWMDGYRQWYQEYVDTGGNPSSPPPPPPPVEEEG